MFDTNVDIRSTTVAKACRTSVETGAIPKSVVKPTRIRRVAAFNRTCGCSGRPKDVGSRPSRPDMTDSIKAMSSRDLARMPCVDRVSHAKAFGARGMRPGVGRSANVPQKLAGVRTEPPRSVPWATVTIPDATAAADPPLDPPELRSRENGVTVDSQSWLTLRGPKPNSGVLVLPRRIPPAAFSRLTHNSSTSGTLFSKIFEPKVVRTPFVCVTSLTAKGTPARGRVRPGILSKRFASCVASSAQTVINACIRGSFREIWAKHSETTSVAEISPERIEDAMSQADIFQSDSVLMPISGLP